MQVIKSRPHIASKKKERVVNVDMGSLFYIHTAEKRRHQTCYVYDLENASHLHPHNFVYMWRGGHRN